MRSLKLSAWGTKGNGWRELAPYTSNICPKKKNQMKNSAWKFNQLLSNNTCSLDYIRFNQFTPLLSNNTFSLDYIWSSKYSKDTVFSEATHNTDRCREKAKHAMLSFGLKEGSFNTSGKHFSTVYLSLSVDSMVSSAKPVYWFGQLK